VAAQNEMLTKANVDYTISGARENGVILQSLATKTVDWNTEGADSVDSSTLAQRTFAITSNSQANPTVVTCASPHKRTTGDIVLIAGVAGSNADVNGSRAVTVVSDTTFTVPINCTVAGGTGGTFVPLTTQDGGAGYLQVTAFSGFSGFIAKVRDSVDDVTYADLITFADVTSAPTAQRVAATGTVDRYLAMDGNVTGAGSITCQVIYCRTLL
jgi:hypothetical protein